MTSETDSDSSSSEQEKKHKKFYKKSKKVSETKHKKSKKRSSHKEKKRIGKDAKQILSDNLKSQTTKSLYRSIENDVSDNTDAFGPALPPHLLNKNKETERNQSAIGPTIPKELLGKQEQSKPQSFVDESLSAELKQTEDDNLQDAYGPLPVTHELEMTPAQIELEQRALELKMAAIDGITATTINQKVREEWMLELPDVGLKTGLAALNNLKRGFHQGKEKPDFSDRSSWTKTPNLGQEMKTSKRSKEDLEKQAQTLYEKQRDAEQDIIAKKHKKKHKRDESLVEIHQKKLRKEEKKKAKELKQSGLKPERRPFTRDVDLKLNQIDRNQTKQIVDKAKILNTKFASGHSKYL